MAIAETYELAVKLRDLAPWRMLKESELFGVRFCDRTVYCSIIGSDGLFHAIAVYPDECGLSVHFSMQESEQISFNLGLAQDVLMCSFEPADQVDSVTAAELDSLGFSFDDDELFPIFERCKPFVPPCHLNGDDEAMLRVALRGAIHIAERIRLDGCTPEELGLRPTSRLSSVIPVVYNADTDPVIEIETMPMTREEYAQPTLDDELLCARVRQTPQTSYEMLAELCRLTVPIADESPYFPLTLLLIDRDSGMVLPPVISRDENGLAEEFAKRCLSACPREIRVRNKQSYSFFANLSEQLDIPLVTVERDSEDYCDLDDMVCEIYGTVSEMSSLSPDEENPILNHDILDDPELSDEERRQLADILRELETYRSEDDCHDKHCGCGHHHEPDDPLFFHDPGYSDGAPAMWNADITADVRCEYCKGVYSPRGILHHLKSCRERMREDGEQEYFLLKVQSENVDGYFLYLDIAVDTKLEKLDDFLRDIWVECCGHDSVFVIDGEEYYSECFEEYDNPMTFKLGDLVDVNDRFQYEYDFGDPTMLCLTVCERYKAKRRRAKIALAARNLLPERKCSRCGNSASYICPECGAELCSKCGSVHSCMPLYELLPLVNSPRCGSCCYGKVFDSDDTES